MLRFAFTLLVLAQSASADGCPVAPDIRAAQADLISGAQAAPNYMAGRAFAPLFWELWSQAPDGPSQQMLDDGMAARRGYDYEKAHDRFSALVNYCPFFAKGYNQRAFVAYLREDYAAALPDLEQVLALNPDHVAALSGKALTLLALGHEAEGQAALRSALALNPWIAERSLLKPDE